MPIPPLIDAQRAHGARYADPDAMAASNYGDPGAEYLAARSALGLADLSYHGWIRACGADRVSYLQGQTTQDLRPLEPGQRAPAAVLTTQGTLVADLRVWAELDYLLLELQPAALPPALAALERFLITEDVTLSDASSEVALFTLLGARSAEAAAELLGCGPLPIGRTTDCQPLHAVRAHRSRTFGLESVDLLVPPEEASAVWSRLVEAIGARPIGEDVWETLRVEAGVPRWARDLDTTVNPLEANLLDHLSETKGCYVGQEIIARILGRGTPAKRLMGLASANGAPLALGNLRHEDRSVGRLTSAVTSPRFGPIGLGLLRKEVATPDQRLCLAAPDSPVEVVVRPLPFE
ncbi:MAG TPA: glycine cleavage T C-terminal barrel domain-containing protein [Armatimonadota bacterium]|jgi:folate-binding protein YgfZ